MKKFHFIYKTTNLVNGLIYVGHHSTDKIDDGYLGSGKYLNKAIEQFGKNNFKREILEFCDYKLLPSLERFWIKELNSTDIEVGYNKQIQGGYCNSGEDSPSWRRVYTLEERMNLSIKNSGENNSMHGVKISQESRDTHSKFMKGLLVGDKNGMYGVHRYGKDAPNWGNHHSPSAIEKIKLSNKNRPILVCPHCGKEGKGAGMYQFHFDHCLQNPNYIDRSVQCPYCSKKSINIGNMNRYHFDNCKYKPKYK